MRRFYVDPAELEKPEPIISGTQADHIRRVLRLTEGEDIDLVDGTGRCFKARITGFKKNAVHVAIIEQTSVRADPDIELILAQGFLKENKMDDLIRQTTELGITRWVPMFTERTVARPDTRRLEKRLKRWRSIAVEAIKQCKRSIVPEISPAMEFSDVLNLADTVDLALFFWEDADSLIPVGSGGKPKSVLLMLGPEGGFSEKEARSAQIRNMQFATLGPRILRAETAALAACSLAQYLYGDLQKSP
ncbi:MAG: 16S rRNA (uracil(1498)-N(3))-methyltransferase [Desulfobacterales bacterium]